MSVKSKTMVKLRIEGKNMAKCDFWTHSDPYLIISRPKRGSYDFTKIRKTEKIQNEPNPKWKCILIPLSELCDENYSLPIRLTVFDEDRNSHDDLIGEAEVTLQILMNLVQTGGSIILKIGQKKRGELFVRECSIVDCSSTGMVRSMSTASYPESRSRSGSISPNFQQHQQPPVSQVDGQMHQYYQHPQQFQPVQPNYYQPQTQYQPQSLHPSYQQPPAAQVFQQPHYAQGFQPPSQNHLYPSLQNNIQSQPPFNVNQFPDDPTDTRPHSIYT